MFSEFSLSDLINLAALLVGVVLLVKKTAEMERFHFARVLLLILFLTGLFFYVLGGMFDKELQSSSCTPDMNMY